MKEIVFEPEYDRRITRLLPGIVAFFLLLFGVVGPLIAFPHWMLVAGLAVPLLLVILFLWFVIYREIRFRRAGITVCRHLFPDIEAGYGEVTDVGPVGFRLGGFIVAWNAMRNREELRAIVARLIEEDRISAARLEGTLAREVAENRLAVILGTTSGIVGWLFARFLGLLPKGMAPEGFAGAVILGGVLLGTPVAKCFLRRF